MKSLGIIPVRLNSERFNNKLLERIDGIPILDRVILNAMQFNFLDKLIIATDSAKIVDYCKIFDIEVFYMTNEVSCGSERAWYVAKKYNDYDEYISIPADEPFINPDNLNKVYKEFSIQENKELIYTCWSKFHDLERLKSTNSCKIVKNKNEAIYFSRGIIPTSKKGILPIHHYMKHIGIFIFSKYLFKMYNNPKDIWLENNLYDDEQLEQNMFLASGHKVFLLEIDHKLYGIDTKDDIKNIKRKLK